MLGGGMLGQLLIGVWCEANKMSGGEETANYVQFDAQRYLTQLFSDITIFQDIPTYVKLFAPFPDNSLTMLDFGGGPNVFPLIMAAEKVTRYIHSDYAKNNRDEVERWKEADSRAFSWKENITRCLKAEGKRGTDEEVASREARMRKVLEAVIPCDVAVDNVVADSYVGPYDIVTCSYCLECVCTSAEAISEAIGRVSKLVKPGGYFILTVSSILDPPESPFLCEETPAIAGFKYRSFWCAPVQSYVDTFETNGYTVVDKVVRPYPHPTLNMDDIYAVIIGKKAN
eukprot:Em0015g524a